MIKSFLHKGLERFYDYGSLKGIQSSHAKKLQLILTRLDASSESADMNLPGLGLHKLSGKLKNHYSVKVNGNWRVTFKFEGGNIILVDYLDYH